MKSYFELFPIVQYQGTDSVDILRRVALRRTIQADPRAFAPYDVPGGQRADQIAEKYYGDPRREWMVWLSAEVLDPYFDWYMTDSQFSAHIVSKYGSIEEAVERIRHWQVAWYNSLDQELSAAELETLPEGIKSYFEPTFSNQSGKVSSYRRRDDDVFAATNMIVTLEVGEHSLEPGDRVQFLDGAELVGQAEACWSNSTFVAVHHVQSDVDPGLTIKKVASGETWEIQARTFTSNTIPVEERVYWEPVSYFEWERDKNESRKSIRLLDARNAMALEIEAERLLKNG